MDWVQGVRALLLVATAVVLLGMIAIVAMDFAKISWGQRFRGIGAVCFIGYTLDAGYDAYQINLEWRWRLVLWIVGVVCIGLWVIQPADIRHRKEPRKEGSND